MVDLAKDRDFDRMTVYFATDRARLANVYTAQRAGLTYGTAVVSIPHGHQTGVMEEARLRRFQLWPKPERDILMLGVPTALSDVDFFALLDDSIQKSSRKDVLIVIHGFWTSFDEAVRHGAQIKADLRFDGPVVVYTWPSFGEAVKYPADENNAEWTTHHLRNFLEEMQAKAPASAIHVVAHSMGNRILAHALELENGCGGAPKLQLGHVVLAAPDIDASTFQDIATSIVNVSRGVTLYASRHDQALAISERLHEGTRAGDAAQILDIIKINGIEAIDVGENDKSLWGHSYVFENPTVLGDISVVLGCANGAVSRTLTPGRYYILSAFIARP
jgi:esterase/lipase superfamily enzyme